MKKKKIPLRKCVVTGEMKPKEEMVRIVKDKEGQISIDPSGKLNGRGAYVSLENEVAELAQEKQALNQPLDTKVSPEFYQELVDYIDHQVARRELNR